MKCMVKEIRLSKGLTQSALADKIGITKCFLSEIENNKKRGSLKTTQLIADALNVDISKLYVKEEIQVIERKRYVPLVAGYKHDNIFADENIIGSVDITHIKREKNKIYYAVQQNGNSMNLFFNDSDVLLIEKTSNFKNGDIVYCLIDNELTTIKTISVVEQKIMLKSETTEKNKFRSNIYSSDRIKVLGKVIKVIK